MEFKLLYRGEIAGEALIALPDQREALSSHSLALLWVLSIEDSPSIAFGFLANRNGTVELSQPIILSLSQLGEQSLQFVSDRPSLGGRLHIDLDTRDATGYIRGYLDGFGADGHIHARFRGQHLYGYLHGDFHGVRGRLRAEIDGRGVQGYVRIRGESFGRGDGEFYLDVDQSGLRIEALGYDPYFDMHLRLRTAGRERIVEHDILSLLIEMVRYELTRRSTDSLRISWHSLVLPTDSEVFNTLLDAPFDGLQELELSHLYSRARARLLEQVSSIRREAEVGLPLPPAYTLVRYPTLEAPMQVFVDRPFMLAIGLGKAPDEGTSGLIVLENLPPDRKSFPVEFEVLSKDFMFTGDNNRGVLEVTPDEQTAHVQLELTPLPIEGEHHLADLIVVFRFDGKRCGTARRTLLILAHETATAEGLLPTSERTPEKKPHLEFVFGTKTPDLVFELFKSPSDTTSFDCHVRSPHLADFPRRYLRSTLNLTLAPATYMNNLYSRIVQQQSEISASNCISAIGDILYDIAPDCFKKAYWKLCDDLGDKFQTIQIYSDEPWIPWELIRPTRQKDDGTIEKHSFLGVEHNVGRWLNMRAGEPPQAITATQATVIAPNYRRKPLPYAKREAEWLEQEVGAIKLTPATKDNVLGFLQDGEAHIIHFSCHGKSFEDANVGEILLEDATLSAFELESREIRFGLAAKYHPLVFINACESGRTGLTLGGVGGLASAFIDISCSAVIGSLWSVDDKDAYEVVQMFYSRLIETNKPLSIADTMQEIRKEFLSRKKDTFLAYTFFGDPHATISLQRTPIRRRWGD